MCSEVIEHVENPFETIIELWRITNKHLVLTTEEFCKSDWERNLRLRAANINEPHAERNFFVAEDFKNMFGSQARLLPLLYYPERLVNIEVSTENFKEAVRLVAGD